MSDIPEKMWEKSQAMIRKAGQQARESFMEDCGHLLPDDHPMKADIASKYNELLYAVATVIPGETRHETALRYIREAENRDNGPVCGQQEKTDR